MKEEAKKCTKSKVLLEDRMKTLQIERFAIKFTTMKCFNVEFEVPTYSAKWFVNGENQMMEGREHWKGKFWEYSQTQEMEKSERYKSAKLIHNIGQQLSSTQACIDTSLVFMHRFYIFHPIKMFPFEVTSGAAFLWGSKSKNTEKSSSQVVKSIMKALKREIPDEFTLNCYVRELNQVEIVMGTTFGFEFSANLPTQYINDACRKLKLVHGSKDFKAVHLMASKSLVLTTFCIRFPPELIAAFSIFMSAVNGKFEVRDKSNCQPWFTIIDEKITKKMLEIMMAEFLERSKAVPKDFTLQEVVILPPEKRTENSVLSKYQQLERTQKSVAEFFDEMGYRKLEISKSPPTKRPKISQEEDSKHQQVSTNMIQQSLIDEKDENRSRHDRFESERPTVQSQWQRSKATSTLTSQSARFADESETDTDSKSSVSVERYSTPKTSVPLRRAISSNPQSDSLSLAPFTRIRSTVPMKIKPLKAIEKEDSSGCSSKDLFSDIPEYYSTVKTKQRVAHCDRNSSNPCAVNINVANNRCLGAKSVLSTFTSNFSSINSQQNSKNVEKIKHQMPLKSLTDNESSTSSNDGSSQKLPPIKIFLDAGKVTLTVSKSQETHECEVTARVRSKSDSERKKKKKAKKLKHKNKRRVQREKSLADKESSDVKTLPPLKMVIKKISDSKMMVVPSFDETLSQDSTMPLVDSSEIPKPS